MFDPVRVLGGGVIACSSRSSSSSCCSRTPPAGSRWRAPTRPCPDRRRVRGGAPAQLQVVAPRVMSFRWSTVGRVTVARQINIALSDAVTKQGIKVAVQGVATVKIGGDEESIRNAAERFLDHEDLLDSIVKNVLEGSLRSIVGTLTVEELNYDRQKFQQEVQTAAKSDLATSGLSIDNFTIQPSARGRVHGPDRPAGDGPPGAGRRMAKAQRTRRPPSARRRHSRSSSIPSGTSRSARRTSRRRRHRRAKAAQAGARPGRGAAGRSPGARRSSPSSRRTGRRRSSSRAPSARRRPRPRPRSGGPRATRARGSPRPRPRRSG